MKFITQSDLFNLPELRPVAYFQGELGKVNSSVLDLYQQRRNDPERLSAQEQINEAERLALDEVPNRAQDLISQLDKKVSRSADLDNENTAKDVEKKVRSMVFEALGQGGRVQRRWGQNYLQLVEDVRDTKNDAILTVQTTQQGVDAITALQAQIERQFETESRERDSVKHMRQGWRRRRTGETQQEVFQQVNTKVQAVIAEMAEKFNEKRSKADELFAETKKILDKGHRILAPAEQAELLDGLEKEAAPNSNFDLAHSANRKIKNAIAGTTRAHRIEVFEKHFGRQSVLSAVITAQKTRERLASEKKIRTELLVNPNDGKPSQLALNAFDPSSLDLVNNELAGFTPQENFTEGKLGTLCEAMERELKAQKINLQTLVYRNQAIAWNYHERFAMLMAYLAGQAASGQSRASANHFSPELKRQLAGAIQWLRELDKPDETIGYSQIFIDFKNQIKTKLAEVDVNNGGSLISQLSSVNNAKDAAAKFNDIAGFLGEVDELDKASGKLKKLSEPEKKTIATLMQSLKFVAGKLSSLQATWEPQVNAYLKGGKDIDAEIKKQKDLIDKKEAEKVALTASLGPSKTRESEINDPANGLPHWQAELATRQSNLTQVQAQIQAVQQNLAQAQAAGNQAQVAQLQVAGQALLQQQNQAQAAVQTAENRITALATNLDKIQDKMDGIQANINALDADISQIKIKVGDAGGTGTLHQDKTDWENDTNTIKKFDFKKAQDFLKSSEAEIKTAVAEANNADLDQLANTVNPDKIALYFSTQSEDENKTYYQTEMEAVQAAHFEGLKGLTEGHRADICYLPHQYGHDLADTNLNTDPQATVAGAIMLDVTSDAVIFLDQTNHRIVIVQQVGETGYQVLLLPAPPNFDGTTNLPPEFFETHTAHFGPLLQVNF